MAQPIALDVRRYDDGIGIHCYNSGTLTVRTEGTLLAALLAHFERNYGERYWTMDVQAWNLSQPEHLVGVVWNRADRPGQVGIIFHHDNGSHASGPNGTCGCGV